MVVEQSLMMCCANLHWHRCNCVIAVWTSWTEVPHAVRAAGRHGLS